MNKESKFIQNIKKYNIKQKGEEKMNKQVQVKGNQIKIGKNNIKIKANLIDALYILQSVGFDIKQAISPEYQQYSVHEETIIVGKLHVAFQNEQSLQEFCKILEQNGCHKVLTIEQKRRLIGEFVYRPENIDTVIELIESGKLNPNLKEENTPTL